MMEYAPESEIWDSVPFQESWGPFRESCMALGHDPAEEICNAVDARTKYNRDELARRHDPEQWLEDWASRGGQPAMTVMEILGAIYQQGRK